MRDRKDDHSHRAALEQKLGRPLQPNEVADHIDEDKSNNAPMNLRAKDRGIHTSDHNKTRAMGLSKLRRSLKLTADPSAKRLY